MIWELAIRAVASAPERIARGEIVGAASIVGLLAAMNRRDGRFGAPER
ncbi:MAG TPA: hypothetical protein VFX60_00660 [Micromonospora sp.]|nr:hypothetical protein [Micromonospora sp.]